MSAISVGDAWENSPYEHQALLVHLAIADVVNDTYDYRFWMLRDALARKARVSVSTVKRTLSQMTKDGWLTPIHTTGGRGKPSEYRYNLSGKPGHPEPLFRETGSEEGDTGSPGTPSSSSTNSRTQNRETGSSDGAGSPSTTAWRLARGRLARGEMVDRGPRNLARAVQDALDVPYAEAVVAEALGRIRGVPIATGNLTVTCSRIASEITAQEEREERESGGRPNWWEQPRCEGRQW